MPSRSSTILNIQDMPAEERRLHAVDRAKARRKGEAAAQRVHAPLLALAEVEPQKKEFLARNALPHKRVVNAIPAPTSPCAAGALAADNT